MKKSFSKIFQITVDDLLSKSLLKFIPDYISPNAFTLSRLLLLPVLVSLLWFEYYQLGVALFILLALSDLIDGALARTRNQVTKWGIFYDPVADKLLIGSTALILLFRLDLLYLGLAVVLIDLVIGMRAIYIKKVYGTVTKAHFTGKIKFSLQFLGMGGILIYILTGSAVFIYLGMWLLYGAVFFGTLSLLVYHSA